ncbi:MAG: 1,4-alpha-glucan branching protein GlgB [Lachnospiraceae bacterium]|nr:1,4-alpha-glucan branching protein GlgB [Lachnospiraceae bacterium]
MDTKTFNKLNKDRIYLFNQGTYHKAYELLGAHITEEDNIPGVSFSVWAPGAKGVHVAGDFNDWRHDAFALMPVGTSGIWTGFVPGACKGQKYKYIIDTDNGKHLAKADPYGYFAEKRPNTASVVWDLDYEWKDARWMDKRAKADHFNQPKNIYEVHLGSWMRHMDKPVEEQFYTYREIADRLIPYVKDMGYTHIEVLPVMEHPLDDSWGYQVTGYFAATARYGTPQDLMYLIDTAHSKGIGVILDWVPAHFCKDEHGLARFNGHKLYEKREHPQWGTQIFDYGRPEVKSFLLSNANFWMDVYHADGLRVDGVSSMLYLNFGIDDPSKKIFNKYGDEGNLEAISFLQDLSIMTGRECPGAILCAEESTAWANVTKPPEVGGLGFHYKWDMGWMNDTLSYVSEDYIYRKYDHNKITFSMMYAYSENYILPLSHDEVIHGKRSIIGRQQGDYDRQFAGLKALAVYQMTHPGGKLNFMGNEIGQFIEWRFYEELEWFLLQYDNHREHQEFIKKLNHIYLKEKALWEQDHGWEGYEWMDPSDAENSILSYVRWPKSRIHPDLVIVNFGWNGNDEYRVGVPVPGEWEILLSSADPDAEGTVLHTEKVSWNDQKQSLTFKLPQTCGVILKHLRRN